jgi:hypothetical protein
VRQTAYGGERGCKIASPLSSKASATEEGGGFPRVGEGVGSVGPGEEGRQSVQRD